MAALDALQGSELFQSVDQSLVSALLAVVVDPLVDDYDRTGDPVVEEE